MVETIIKRDGREVYFDLRKVKRAILKAADKVNVVNYRKIDDVVYNIYKDIEEKATKENRSISVEEIQDLVEKNLIIAGEHEVSKEYILYRYERNRTREMNSSLMKVFNELTFTSAKDSDIKRDNANINADTSMGTMLKYGSISAKEFYELYVLNPVHAKAHREGYIHIHDLDFFALTTTCTQIDLNKLFTEGFSTGHGFLREPNSIASYAALTAIAIQSNQNDQHGGQSIPKFDYDLSNGVRKTFKKVLISNLIKSIKILNTRDEKFIEEFENKLTEKDDINLPKKSDIKDLINNIETVYRELSEQDTENEIYRIIEFSINESISETDRMTYQAMEGLVHNLNTMHSRCGAQVPFSSINYGTDTSEEGRMVIKNILLAEEAGLGNGETPIFPIHIFKVKEGINFNPEDPNYDLFQLACKVSAKRLFPNFSFIDAPFNLQYYKEGNPDTEVAYMGCVQGSNTISFKVNIRGSWCNFDNMRFDEAYRALCALFTEETHPSNFINTDGNVLIKDSSSEEGYVNCKKFIKNPPDKNNWVKLVFSNDKTLICTLDHPLPVMKKEDGEWKRTLVSDIELGDIIPTTTKRVDGKFVSIMVDEIIHLSDLNEYSYDVETSSDKFDVSGLISHNCRTRVMGNVYDSEREIVTGRGNLSFTTINLPRLAIEANGDLDKFYKLLDDMMNLVIEQLMFRYHIQAQRRVKNFPFLMGQGIWLDSDKLDIEDTLEEVLKHGSLSCGFLGLAECLKSLIGEHHGESEKARELGLEIITRMRDRMDKEAEKTKFNFTLLATPAESTCGRFVELDAKKYGIIKGVTDREYYTNSFHVPVYYNITAGEKIHIEAPYHALTNAGHISYIELDGDPVNNVAAFEKIIRYMKDEGIGYGSVNHPVDRDPICGYTGIIFDKCPKCGRKDDDPLHKFERIRRITGYLAGTLDRFNNAKKAEVRDRVKHM